MTCARADNGDFRWMPGDAHLTGSHPCPTQVPYLELPMNPRYNEKEVAGRAARGAEDGPLWQEATRGSSTRLLQRTRTQAVFK